ncbi:hypothetical protein BCD48_11045 [Pseudofrankia sp. BMG5.36]|nr:hypothetical protein BCD48_11045 [Pseudofrankia sp. BMG5.36]
MQAGEADGDGERLRDDQEAAGTGDQQRAVEELVAVGVAGQGCEVLDGESGRAGGRTGGRKPKMTAELIDKAQRMCDSRQFTMAEIAAGLEQRSVALACPFQRVVVGDPVDVEPGLAQGLENVVDCTHLTNGPMRSTVLFRELIAQRASTWRLGAHSWSASPASSRPR